MRNIDCTTVVTVLCQCDKVTLICSEAPGDIFMFYYIFFFCENSDPEKLLAFASDGK